MYMYVYMHVYISACGFAFLGWLLYPFPAPGLVRGFHLLADLWKSDMFFWEVGLIRCELIFAYS